MKLYICLRLLKLNSAHQVERCGFFIYQNYKIKYITWFKLCHIVLNRSNTLPSAELSFPACVCLFLRYLCSPTGLMVMLTSLQIHVPSPHLLMFSGCMRTRGTALPGTGKHTHRWAQCKCFPVHVWSKKNN